MNRSALRSSQPQRLPAQANLHWLPTARAVPPARQKLLIVLQAGPVSPEMSHALRERFALKDFEILAVELESPVKSGRRKGMATQLASLLEELRGCGWNLHHVFLLGIGVGASAVWKTVMTYPRTLGGAIASGGEYGLEEGWRQQLPASAFHTPCLMIHGFFDENVAVDSVRAVRHELQSVGLHLNFRELNKTETFDEELELPLIAQWLRDRSRTSRAKLASRARPEQI